MAGYVRVFVYGTLKRNFPNHKLLSQLPDGQVANFLSDAKTVNKFPLVVATPANIPFLLDVPATGEHVEGEVYEVCKTTLAKLDELEDEGRLYHRKTIHISLSDVKFNDKQIEAFVYILVNFKEHLMELTFLSSFNQQHVLQYKSKAERNYDIYSHVKD